MGQTTMAAIGVLTDVIGDRQEIGLGDACRRLEPALRKQNIIVTVDPRWVSSLLRRMGWSKAGMTGTGYDREPLYRRAG